MLRLVSDALLRTMARWRPRVRTRPGIVKVNLGAGIEVAAGWINVDGGMHALLAGAPRFVLGAVYRRTGTVSRLITEAEYVRRLSEYEFVFCDFANGLPFEDDSVDYIFCSHVLEHFFVSDAARLVGEMRRVLKPGGGVRICVPDLARAVELYGQGAKRAALDYFFTDERARFDQHRYMYDYELLADMLAGQGFTDVRNCAFGEGSLPDLAQLDNRPEQTLYVEGIKPAS